MRLIGVLVGYWGASTVLDKVPSEINVSWLDQCFFVFQSQESLLDLGRSEQPG